MSHRLSTKRGVHAIARKQRRDAIAKRTMDKVCTWRRMMVFTAILNCSRVWAKRVSMAGRCGGGQVALFSAHHVIIIVFISFFFDLILLSLFFLNKSASIAALHASLALLTR